MIAYLRQNISVAILGALAIAAAIATGLIHGAERFWHAFWHAADLFLFIMPSLIAGMLLASSIRQLMDPGSLARWMGAESGWKGLFIATLAGMATPGGPMAAFPLILVFASAGADRGTLIAYISAWTINGWQRILVYEAPLLGVEFAMLRLVASLPVPVLIGWLARRIPIAWTPPTR